jgi:biopolymer transport protein ExbD
MSFEGFNDKDEPISDINMTPLIDVMLVLLVIFIITAPLLTHAIKVDLPKEKAVQSDSSNKNISISIDAAGKIFFGDKAIKEDALTMELNKQAAINKDISVEIRADNKSEYKWLARVMSIAQQSGLYKIGFVVDSNANK